MNQDQIKANLLSTDFWIRMVFMLIFALVLIGSIAVSWWSTRPGRDLPSG